MNEQILLTLRKIIRAIDLHSKKIAQQHGLTVPQLILLHDINKYHELSVGELAIHSNLSNATVTDILDRLESRGFIMRKRSSIDKRRVLITLTEKAKERLVETPPLLQEHFVRELNDLEEWERSLILASLQRVASMMDADHIEANPVLVNGADSTVSG